MARGLVLAAIGAGVLATAAWAAAPDQAAVQGLYQGTWTSGGAEGKLTARVVALADHAYKVLAIQGLADGKTKKVELKGSTAGDAVTFAADGWRGAYADGAISGTIGGGSFTLKRTDPKSPTLGKKPPEGAVVLLDGKNLDTMERGRAKDGKPSEWQVDENDGSVLIPRRGMRSKHQVEGSYDLHVEFLLPLRADKTGQGRGNSGVHLPCGQEIQVLDSFGMTTYKGGGCGGLYRWKDPDAFDEFNLASYPPLAWQTYDVEVRVRKDDKGQDAIFLTVHHNGIKIHDNVRLPRKPRKGDFRFQDHANPVRYRNIWVLPIKGE